MLIAGLALSARGAEIPRFRRAPIASRMTAPTAVAVDGVGNVYVTESTRGRVLVFDGDGNCVRARDGLRKPLGVAADGAGRIYVCSAGARAVLVLDGHLAPLRKLGAGDGEFRYPTAVAAEAAGNVYVVDAGENRVKVYEPSGAFLRSFGGAGNGDGEFNFPVSVAVNEAAGEVVVSDLQATATGCRGARVQVFSRDGSFRRSFGAFGEGEGSLIRPMGLAVDGAGRTYVSDAYQNVVQVFDGEGRFTGAVYDLEHPLRTPLGIAYDGTSGRLLVASLNGGRVEVFGGEAQGGGGETGGGGSGDGGDDGDGDAPMSFSRSGGSGCSVAAGLPGEGPRFEGWMAPWIALLVLIAGRGRAGRRRR